MDFFLYEIVDFALYGFPKALDDYPAVRAFKATIESLPAIDALRKSDR